MRYLLLNESFELFPPEQFSVTALRIFLWQKCLHQGMQLLCQFRFTCIAVLFFVQMFKKRMQKSPLIEFILFFRFDIFDIAVVVLSFALQEGLQPRSGPGLVMGIEVFHDRVLLFFQLGRVTVQQAERYFGLLGFPQSQLKKEF